MRLVALELTKEIMCSLGITSEGLQDGQKEAWNET
jgi:hypothetical protein